MMVELISQDNQVFVLKYYELNEFCKMICLKQDNKEAFEEFKKDYTYFEPYFDFVMFELKYQIHGCLFEDDYLFCNNNQLYSKNALAKNNNMPYMAKCSDSVLRIKEITKNTPTAMVDPKGMEMMCSLNEEERGLHIVTCRTILNQLMIQNRRICEYCHVFNFNPITVLIDMGFIRTLDKEYEEALICREELLTNTLKRKINAKKIIDFGFTDQENIELLGEYLKIINKNRKVDLEANRQR